MMLQSCAVPITQRRLPRQQLQLPADDPPLPREDGVHDDDDDDDEELRAEAAELKRGMAAVVISVFFQVAIFLLVIPAIRRLPNVPPAWELLLWFAIVASFCGVLYFGIYFAFGVRFAWALRVLVSNQIMVVLAGVIRRPGDGDVLIWNMLLCSLICMLYMLLQ